MCSSISCLYIVFSNCIALVIMPRTLPWAENAGLHYPQATDALLSSWFLTNWTKPSQSNPVTREPDMSGGRVNPTSRHIDYDSMFFTAMTAMSQSAPLWEDNTVHMKLTIEMHRDIRTQ